MKSTLSCTLIICLVGTTYTVAQEPVTSRLIARPITHDTVPTELAAAHVPSTVEPFAGRRGSDGLLGDVRLVMNVRTELDAYRHSHRILSVELKDGSRFTGSVGKCRTDRFELVQAFENRTVVPYDQVAAFLNPATGRVLSVVQQPGLGGVKGSKLFWSVVIIVGLLSVVYVISHLPKT